MMFLTRRKLKTLCFTVLPLTVYVLFLNVIVDKLREIKNTGKGNRNDLPQTSQLASSADGPRKVMIVTYQRSGSTFLGEMFNLNPDAFYWFEPMEAIYQQMYGTYPGYAVPSDIRNFENGSDRFIPEVERRHLIQAAVNILNCTIEKLPTELLTSNFFVYFNKNQKRVGLYKMCLDRAIPYFRDRFCMNYLSSICSDRFGRNWTLMAKCQESLNPDTSLRGDMLYDVDEELYKKDPLYVFLEETIVDKIGTNAKPTPENDRIMGQMMDDFRGNLSNSNRSYDELMGLYKTCVNNRRKLLTKCLPQLRDTCSESAIRSLKTIRMTLDNALAVRKQIPDVKIIYNIRTPIAVALSRRNTADGDSYMSLYSQGNSYLREVELICRDIKRDLDVYRSIQGGPLAESVHLNTYEQYSAQTGNTLEEIYRFIGASPKGPVQRWLTTSTKHSAYLATRWRLKIDLNEYAHYRNLCTDLFHEHADILPDEMADIPKNRQVHEGILDFNF